MSRKSKERCAAIEREASECSGGEQPSRDLPLFFEGVLLRCTSAISDSCLLSVLRQPQYDVLTSLSGARLSPLNFERGGSLEVVRWALVVGAACYYRAGAWRPTKQAIDSV